MRDKPIPQRQSKQRGQTLVLVALCIAALFAMAALAIDLTALYAARTEMQRTADAAALAGAKAIADSGVTNNPSDGTLQGIATTLAMHTISALLAQNTVGGVAPTLVGTLTPCPASTCVDYGSSDVRLTVTLQRTMPTFFARIWVIGRSLATVSATATAEAYNPSGNSVPVVTKCVKPWIIANTNPQDTSAPPNNTFVDPTTGAVNHPALVINGQQVKLCLPGASCSVTPPSLNLVYAPAQVTLAASSLCPSCNNPAKSDYQQSIDCCNNQVYSCGDTVTVNTTATGTETGDGVECLIHSTGLGLGNGQDTLDTSAFSASSGPLFVKSGGINNPTRAPVGTPISTSDSVVTFLIATAATLPASGTVTVAGFMRAFVASDDPLAGGGDISVTFLNVAGCSASPSGTPVYGGGVSPIPVRLIHQ
jgi:Putative Flp pilus-assembly TadE/G-like